MRGKVAMMGATIVMVAAVGMVLSLVLVLLADLYCTLLLRKRRRHPNTTTCATAAATNRHPASAPSLCSFYAQGVIRAPRSFLFPAPPESDKQIFHNNLRYSSAHRETASPEHSSTTSGGADDHLIYICNPMYDGGEAIIGKIDTPFETPATSPSNLDIESGSTSSSGGGSSPPILTPQLTPMKKLPAEGANSVSLRDAAAAGSSDSNAIFFGGVSSSSSSASPSTSPSW